MKKKIHDKIRRLLALADGNPNPHEAAAAAGKAQELMSAHAIAEAELHVDDAEDEIVEETLGERTRNQVPWRGILTGAIAEANHCEVYWGQVAWSLENPRKRRVLRLIGTATNVATVRYLYAALTRMCRASAKEALQQGLIAGRKGANAYRLGWANTVGGRLLEASKAAKQSASDAALVRLDQEALRAAAALPDGLRGARSPSFSDRSAFAQGVVAGERADLGSRAGLSRGDGGRLAVRRQLSKGGQ